MTFQLLIALHLLGIISWLGALAIFSLLLKKAASGAQDEISPALRKQLFRSCLLFQLLGFGLVLVTGLSQLMMRGMEFYFSQGWFHAKLSAVFLLLLLSLLLIREFSRFSESGRCSKGMALAIHIGSFFLTFAIITLTEISIF